jgi:hypothetical protein
MPSPKHCGAVIPAFALSVAILLLALASASAGARAWRDCGTHASPGPYAVQAFQIDCGKARRVAHRYLVDETPFGFSCQTRSTSFESKRVFCRRTLDSRVQKVRFGYGL